MSTAIKIENLSKQYRLGLVGTNTLHGDIKHWWAKMRGREKDLYKIGEENKLNDVSGEYVWALRDINLEVQQGEVLGIIGKNGAGKSTLLKILSQVTGPTTGSIKVKGRIASLLEVGTGFHGELTGRENIFLNGAILGMKRHEIIRKFDEIVDFAGVAKYIDTPVKRYSSGMYVRLAFAVAAFLEPEILVVDEVLAVGDAEFQKKAIGKMQDVSTNEGRAVLFVSHNMVSVKALCSKSVLMTNGTVDTIGDTNSIIDLYQKANINNSSLSSINWSLGEKVKDGLNLLEFSLINTNGVNKEEFMQTEPVFVKLNIKSEQEIKNIRFNFHLLTAMGDAVLSSTSHKVTKDISFLGSYEFVCQIPANFLGDRNYIVRLGIDVPGVKIFWSSNMLPNLSFRVIGEGTHGSVFKENWPGYIAPAFDWTIKQLSNA